MTAIEIFLTTYCILTTLKIICLFVYTTGLEKRIDQINEENSALSERVFSLFGKIKKGEK